MCARISYLPGQEFAIETSLHARGPDLVVHYIKDTNGDIRLLSVLEEGRLDRDYIHGLQVEDIKKLKYRCLVAQC